MSRLKDLVQTARTEETCYSREGAESTGRPLVRGRLKRTITYKAMRRVREGQGVLGEELAPRLMSRNGQVATAKVCEHWKATEQRQ